MSEKNESGINPVFNRIVVKRKEIQTNSAIVLPDEVKNALKASQGEILAVGPEASSGFKLGHKIVWGKYAGVEVDRGGVPYVCMNDEDVIGIIDEYEEAL